ncbi:membrane protein of unknown function [Tenacibaculum sp. 190130A14a]|uniref:Uncharacterized protein n=1 Tax=Tenacibaculum polynesiense TaxID=3137857 RepID=A0ABP1EX55_9FLAO
MILNLDTAVKKLRLYFLFYRTKFFLSLAFSLFILLKLKAFFWVLIALITAVITTWFYHRFINDRKKQTLYFYYNFGLTEFKLYSFIFFLNFFLLVCINLIIKWIF